MATNPKEIVLPLTGNLHFVDDLYDAYKKDPASVDPSWQRLFSNGVTQPLTPSETAPWEMGQALGAPLTIAPSAIVHTRVAELSALVNAYRVRGHMEASLDPLGSTQRGSHPDLDPKSYGFQESDLDVVRVPTSLFRTPSPITLRELIARLRETYCGTAGVEYMHISDPARRRWLQERLERPGAMHEALDTPSRRLVLDQLIAATELERFIEAKYVGSKRFSLEGGEALLPMLYRMLERAGDHGIEEAVLGMAHRGRLNVLVNLLGMSARHLFAEFEDFAPETTMGGGDVKYHLGYSTDHVTRAGKKIHLSLCFNPSHLEAVDPVVMGRVRAKQRRRQDPDHRRVLGVLVHGDAAFAGQGLVAETLQLSDLRGYRVGGMVHVIVNNQIGFTTSPTDSRSTPYPTDVAKMTQVPIFHVNGDDAEAVMRVTEIAMDYRRQFASDVVLDIFCFRRHGHNETDEPSFTQPLLYDKIKRHPATYEVYGRQLIGDGVVAQKDIDDRVQAQHRTLTEDLGEARKQGKRPVIEALGGAWQGYAGGPEANAPEAVTAVPRAKLEEIAKKISTIPDGFHAHPKIVRLMQQRAEMGRGEKPLDWAMGEALAFGTLVDAGTVVRLSGQDCRRGTFSQRHAVIVDVQTGDERVALQHLHDPGPQTPFRIYDSSLSEAGVLGFEFGYSLDMPDGLVMWEAQFGDFANGAQVILDQFVSSSEDRWRRLSGLVLLLPHGYEGQGPEHSSARMERYLQNCGEDNWQVCYPTTPAQYFHLLRRQVLRKWRKPLVVMTPKSMLRLPAAASPLDELATGRFEKVLPDPEAATLDAKKVERAFLSTGKIAWDLLDERKKRSDAKTALIRIEQLYPLTDEQVLARLEGFGQLKELVWVQEEPMNMGAWRFLRRKLERIAKVRGTSLRRVTRAESASPATGSHKAHQLEHRKLMDEAFGG